MVQTFLAQSMQRRISASCRHTIYIWFLLITTLHVHQNTKLFTIYSIPTIPVQSDHADQPLHVLAGSPVHATVRVCFTLVIVEHVRFSWITPVPPQGASHAAVTFHTFQSQFLLTVQSFNTGTIINNMVRRKTESMIMSKVNTNSHRIPYTCWAHSSRRQYPYEHI